MKKLLPANPNGLGTGAGHLQYKPMKNPTAYLKMRVLGAIDMAEGKSIQARIQAVSQMTFTDEQGQACQFTWRTIQSWYSRYQKHGLTVLENKSRSDKGKTRKLSTEVLAEAVRQVLPKVHGQSPSLTLLYRLCIEEGLFTRSQLARNTFGRLVKKYELLKPEQDCSNKLRLAFAKAHANELWQADTLIGPYLQHDGSATQTRLIAFLDDASRVCCHGQFFLAENVDTLIEALRAAFYKRGVPQSLYVDNGSIYCSKEIIQICARVGCLLHHTPVRDGAAKGKIERFFRTVREQFLSLKLDLSSVEALNRQFIAWVEEQYNAQKHSVLQMTPLDRFALDRSRVRYLPPNQANDELFFVEEERHVRADNTFSFKALRFEAPRHLPDRTIQIRFQRKDPASRVIVYYKGERMGEARRLDPVANDRKPVTLSEFKPSSPADGANSPAPKLTDSPTH
ncbi:MAG TPA: DDE-type integrase/transposase/recombinase [Candidatus Angelobacter sp.]|nr:DDE-type integrase/transposase/recombinase [Candidatus Angelobacter sp.]